MEGEAQWKESCSRHTGSWMSLDSMASMSHDTCPQNSQAASLLIVLANATLTMLQR